MMRNRTTRLRSLFALLILAIAAAIGAYAANSTPAKPRPPQTTPPVTATPPDLKAFPTPAAAWKEVDRLQQEQKMQAALDLATKIREAAQQKGESAEWSRGLVRETQLRMALHGYEPAVRFLRETPSPDDPLPHAVLDLFYAQALVTYQRAYGYEIARREEVISTAVPDVRQ